jgi:nicotinamidase-related amidase
MIRLEPNRTALLVMDLQADILSRYGDAVAPMLERVAGVVAAARKARLSVIYVVVGFRPGYPEVSARNMMFSAVLQTGRFLVTPPGSDVAPAIRPEEGDIVVVKHRVSAFAGTDLDMVLRAKGIDTLVLLGVATSGVVLSTIRHGADADYRLVVVKDCCTDGDEEVHRVLTEKVFVRQATVVTAAEVTAALEGV